MEAIPEAERKRRARFALLVLLFAGFMFVAGLAGAAIVLRSGGAEWGSLLGIAPK